MTMACLMKGCKNRHTRQTLKQFFNIPRPENRRQEWILASGLSLEEGNRVKRQYVCEDHFCVSILFYIYRCIIIYLLLLLFLLLIKE